MSLIKVASPKVSYFKKVNKYKCPLPSMGYFYCVLIIVYVLIKSINIMKESKKIIKMTPKRQEIIKNLSITISKESKKVNLRNTKLIEILQKILDKTKP